MELDRISAENLQGGEMRIGVNGAGRIGRSVIRAAYLRGIEVGVVNDLMEIEQFAYLLEWDSIRGRFPAPVKVVGRDRVKIGEWEVRYSRSPSPAEANFDGVEVVIEATGRFLTTDLASPHLKGSVKKVILSAPAQDEETPTFVMGVNHHLYNGEAVVSNGSCTTNCLAPVAMVLDQKYGIERGFMTTIHSYTMDQRLLDSPNNRDIRRSRGASINIIPTFTGAAKAIYRVLPNLKGKLDGRSVRVPVPNVSLMELVVELKAAPTGVEELTTLFEKEAEGRLKGILEVDHSYRVSSDINGNPHSSILAADLTKVNGRLIQLFSWYDNEWGYANRLLDLALYILQNG
jgi:glyceraldehyde 3-phosphate dehydrogenase